MDNLKPSPLVEKYQKNAKQGSVLDIGIGRGDDSIFLAEKGFFVTAVDIKENIIESFKKRVSLESFKIEIVSKNIKDFDIKKNNYTLIIAINSLHFLEKKVFFNVLEKIKNGLRKGGICIIAVFTDEDPMVKEGKVGNNYFPKAGELKNIFEKDFEVLFYKEAVINDKGHPGNESPHMHSVARIVAKK